MCLYQLNDHMLKFIILTMLVVFYKSYTLNNCHKLLWLQYVIKSQNIEKFKYNYYRNEKLKTIC